jgi:hypothetical protein
MFYACTILDLVMKIVMSSCYSHSSMVFDVFDFQLSFVMAWISFESLAHAILDTFLCCGYCESLSMWPVRNWRACYLLLSQP